MSAFCDRAHARATTVLKLTSSYRARAKKVYHAWEQYRVLTLVKETGLWGSNVLEHSKHYLV